MINGSPGGLLYLNNGIDPDMFTQNLQKYSENNLRPAYALRKKDSLDMQPLVKFVFKSFTSPKEKFANLITAIQDLP